MTEINELLKQYNIKPKSYKKIKNVMLIETENKNYIIKKKTKDNQKIYDYLKTRNFNYIPKIITNSTEDYEILEYIKSYEIPKEQKILDLVDLVSLLHNKTTHYKETTENDYNQIYEDLKNNIQHLYSYYDDIITIIESKIYMSPSEYLLARNISIIYSTLNFLEEETQKWYNLIKNNTKQRQVVLHNNLEIDHFINNEKNYLISWNKSKIGLPLFDIYKLYLKHNLEFDFSEILKRYEKNYPLHEEEKKLLFILMMLPQKIEFTQNEYEDTKQIRKKLDVIYKTRKLILPYYSDKRPENNTHKQENKENIKST